MACNQTHALRVSQTMSTVDCCLAARLYLMTSCCPACRTLHAASASPSRRVTLLFLASQTFPTLRSDPSRFHPDPVCQEACSSARFVRAGQRAGQRTHTMRVMRLRTHLHAFRGSDTPAVPRVGGHGSAIGFYCYPESLWNVGLTIAPCARRLCALLAR